MTVLVDVNCILLQWWDALRVIMANEHCITTYTMFAFIAVSLLLMVDGEVTFLINILE